MARRPAPVPHDSPDEVEAQFYDAMRRADIALMMAVWADDEEAVCVHPGGARVLGTAAIRASFEAIFTQGSVPVHTEQVHRLQTMGASVHHLVERISVSTETGTQTAWIVATNVYIRTALGWRMVAHHASPGTAEDPGEGEAPSVLH